MKPTTCSSQLECQVDCRPTDPRACTRRGRFTPEREAPDWYRLGCKYGDREGCDRAAIALAGDHAWDKACEADIPEACEKVGWAHVSGTAPAANAAHGHELLKRAARLYRRGCKAASGLDCRLLAEMTVVGLGVPQDDAAAASLFERACDLEDMDACERLGTFGASAGAVDKACATGAEGCNTAGLRTEFGNGIEQDPQKAVDLYMRACLDENDGQGCDLLGYAYETGIGVARDDKKAHKYYTASCRYRHAQGCYDLARTYIDSRGTSANTEYAAVLLRETCGEDMDGLGCNELIDLYERGLAQAPSSTSVTDMLAVRCDKHDGPACVKLAHAYATGRGVGVDGARALQIYVKACDFGHGPGCTAAAYMLDVGDLVTVDRERAELLFGRGCDAGDDVACREEARRYGPLKPRKTGP